MRNDGGFSLLETLVAIAILAAVTIAFTSGMTTGWRSISAAEADMRALALARNELERAGVEWPLASGSRRGVAPDGLLYEVRVVPAVGGQQPSQRTRRAAYWVAVEVHGNGIRRPIRLQTLKAEGAQ